MEVNLLRWTAEPFRMHSGGYSNFKIECDALSRDDCMAAANVLASLLEPFSTVEAVPSTSHVPRWLAAQLLLYSGRTGGVLIVDDVLTTGASMEEQRAGREAIGAVIFARGPCPSWITPLFRCNV